MNQIDLICFTFVQNFYKTEYARALEKVIGVFSENEARLKFTL